MKRTDPTRFRLAAWAQMQRAEALNRDLARRHLKGLIEALLFATPDPLPVKALARGARARKAQVQELLDELSEEYADRGVQLLEVAGGFAFRTHPAYGSFVRELVAKKPVRMTRAQLETLAIISYRQPITRPEIDEIRGVDSGPVLRTLLERDLIRILGKKEEPGRPLLYSTTPEFLKLFGLDSLAALPTLREFTELSDDSRAHFEARVGEPPPLPNLENIEIVEEGEEAEASDRDETDGDDDDETDGDDDDETDGDDDDETDGDGDDDDETDGDDEDDDDEDDDDEDDDDEDDEDDEDDDDEDDEDDDRGSSA